jgi:hypothetical protein
MSTHKMTALSLAQLNAIAPLIAPATPLPGEEGCLERVLLWSATAADETWRQMPLISVVAGSAIVDYRPCTVDIVVNPKATEFYAFIQALVPLRTNLNSLRRPNLYQEARQYNPSPNIVSAYLA